MAQVLELPSKLQALSSNPSTSLRKKNNQTAHTKKGEGLSRNKEIKITSYIKQEKQKACHYT
jgi:hypothetical protein